MSAERASRRELLKEVRRAVVKVGSGVLTADSGLNMAVIRDMAASICALYRQGIQIVLVSSGAIAAGLRKIELDRRPSSLSQQQAVAAVGQSTLMRAYEEAFGHHHRKVAQVLLTRDDLTHRRRYLNARNTLFTLLSWGIVPVINENDTVVADEIKFGDNDNLSAMVTNLTESQLLVNLTNIDGLFDRDPRFHADAELLRTVEQVDQRVRRYASSIPGFLGRGGMASKVRAAQMVAVAGVPTIIANGLRAGILKQVFKGKEVGTLFLPQPVSLRRRKHWIAFTKAPKGSLIIDEGAENAVSCNGKSLLPSGIRMVEGRFNRGDAVILRSQSRAPLAVGLVNYHSGEVRRILGVKSSEIEKILGFEHDEEVVHRDNLVLISQVEDCGELCS